MGSESSLAQGWVDDQPPWSRCPGRAWLDRGGHPSSVPVYVSIATSLTINLQGKPISGDARGEDVGISLQEEGDRAILKEPFNNTTVSMALKGLNAVNVIVNPTGVHILGNYEPTEVAHRCCVTLCGTTACCIHACVTCGSTTACC